ncbi:NAD-P-binding protein [Glonium stellatum]|uniref:NAD-P-binding protein n=1 Tax=Glonium stellatum TaxID=574774 RepID=A0A8E2FAA6_9PEZI|nr:NAD-P-binding protein [Glonium stellatum]
MAPTRVGFIGLSASGRWAADAHLPYIKDSSKYTITALCNSSVESARAAIKAYGLPSSTKAYGSPKDLANDPNVDLVVCSVRVDKHYDALIPALEAGKDCFCEWPLGKNLQEGRQLAELAKKKGVKTMVGLQARKSPVFKKVKDLVDSGRIGKVLSVTYVATAYNMGAAELKTIAYFNDKDVGGNMVTIHFSHGFYGLLYAVGELKSYSSILETKRPQINIIDKPLTSPDSKVVSTVTRTSHDQVLLQGHLESGALLTYHLRGGKPFGNEPGLLWRVYGETGEIQVTSSGSSISVGYPDTKIQLHDHASGNVEVVEVESDGWEKLPIPAQNIGRLYEAFADGKTAEYPDWEEAVVRHKLVEELYQRGAGSAERPAEYLL